MRMVPFSSQAERLYRIVRQTAKELANAPTWKSGAGRSKSTARCWTRSAPVRTLNLRNAVPTALRDPHHAGLPKARLKSAKSR